MRAVFLSMLVCLAAGRTAGADVVDRIAAAVNDTAIPESEVRKAMVVSALAPEPGEGAEAYRGRVLDALIDQHLEYEDALRFGPVPPDAAEIQTALDKLGERLKADGKDPAAEYARAGMTAEDVRASIERQLVIARYLRERFSPISYADEEQAREEYEKRYLPEERAAGRAVPPFETVADEMRRRSSARAFDEAVAHWLAELRQKSRVSIYRMPVPIPDGRTVVVLSTAPPPTKTPAR